MSHKLPRLRLNTSSLLVMATRVHVQLPRDVRLLRQMLSHMNCPPLTVTVLHMPFLDAVATVSTFCFFESFVSIVLALIIQSGGSVGQKLHKLVLNCIRQEEKERISACCSACKSSRRMIFVYSASRSLSPVKKPPLQEHRLGDCSCANNPSSLEHASRVAAWSIVGHKALTRRCESDENQSYPAPHLCLGRSIWVPVVRVARFLCDVGTFHCEPPFV